ncbi:ImmA/IrrE family metallo-endopeptidase [Psychrobacillus sp. BM2]|uniref:ImmA/IrrE family metallo-endopeptidase n=1 Tax=Psychrobacillus sp. BM2 TaxID=3400421 RepID=UPI003B0158FB
MVELMTLLKYYQEQKNEGNRRAGQDAVWSMLYTSGFTHPTLIKGLQRFFASNKSFADIESKGKFRLFELDVQLVQYGERISHPDGGYLTFTEDSDLRELILKAVINKTFDFFSVEQHGNITEDVISRITTLLDENQELEELLFFSYSESIEDNVIKIGHRMIPVDEVEHLITNSSRTLNKGNKDFHSINGVYDHEHDSIQYEKNMSNHSKLNTIVHEILHGMIGYSNMRFDEMFKRHDGVNSEIEEEIVSTLSNVASMIILDNPKFIKQLSQLLVNDELEAQNVADSLANEVLKDLYIEIKKQDGKMTTKRN